MLTQVDQRWQFTESHEYSSCIEQDMMDTALVLEVTSVSSFWEITWESKYFDPAGWTGGGHADDGSLACGGIPMCGYFFLSIENLYLLYSFVFFFWWDISIVCLILCWKTHICESLFVAVFLLCFLFLRLSYLFMVQNLLLWLSFIETHWNSTSNAFFSGEIHGVCIGSQESMMGALSALGAMGAALEGATLTWDIVTHRDRKAFQGRSVALHLKEG